MTPSLGGHFGPFLVRISENTCYSVFLAGYKPGHVDKEANKHVFQACVGQNGIKVHLPDCLPNAALDQDKARMDSPASKALRPAG